MSHSITFKFSWVPPGMVTQPPPWAAPVDGTAVEAEPFHKFSITFFCHVTDGSRGAVWQNGVWHGSADMEAKGWNWIPQWGKKLYPLTFIDAWWMFVEAKQWMWAQWGSGWLCFSSGDSNSRSPLLVQIFTNVACRLLFITGENILMLKNSVL